MQKNKKALLFTGQGFQRKNMLHDLPKNEITTEVLNLAQTYLNQSVLEIDSEKALKLNSNVQMCIYIMEIIYMKHYFFNKNFCDYVAGHSVGTFAAAVCIGAISFEDGLKLVKLRGELMQELFPTGYGMMEIDGLSEAYINNILREENINIFLSCCNSQTQIICSGKKIDLLDFEHYIKQKFPVKTKILNISVPSHCKLMKPVSDRLRSEFKNIEVKTPQIPYITNTTARKTIKNEIIAMDLIEGVSKTVRYFHMTCLMKELDITEFIEMSDAPILSNLGKQSFPELNWDCYKYELESK